MRAVLRHARTSLAASYHFRPQFNAPIMLTPRFNKERTNGRRTHATLSC